jgi:hypothetical protein
MEKTLEMHLAEQKDNIYEAVIGAPTPELLDWNGKIIWQQARIEFARLIMEANYEGNKIK